MWTVEKKTILSRMRAASAVFQRYSVRSTQRGREPSLADNGYGGCASVSGVDPASGAAGGTTTSVERQNSDFRSTHFNRAKARTLRMTVVIVLAFILCWTPNVVLSLW